jgi:alpha-1,3-rhamnosyltransferase
LSVCCLTFNHERFLNDCVESIFKQDYDNIEILVLDDGSTDKTSELLNKISKNSRFPFFLINQDNTGNVAKNLNKLIHLSNGEMVMIMSMDDKFLPNTFGLLVKELNKSEDIQFVTPISVISIDEHGNITEKETFNNLSKIDRKNIKISNLIDMERDDAGSFFVQGCLFRKSLLLNSGMYDEDLLGDDIVLRTKIFRHMSQYPNMKFEILDSPTCYYRSHQNNIHKNRERQCEIIYQVAQRYFNGKTSYILDDWVEGTIIHNIVHNNLKDALRLILWDKKNKKKIKIFLSTAPILFKKLNYIIQNFIANFNLFGYTNRIFGLFIYRIRKYSFKNKRPIRLTVIEFKIRGDSRGSLVSIEPSKNLPFRIKRVYYIYGTKQGIIRGSHAHIRLKQLLVCVSGSCKMLLDNGKEKKEVELNSPDKGLLIKSMIWREMYDFSPDCVLMVLADNFYNEDDYIRDYKEFKKLCK